MVRLKGGALRSCAATGWAGGCDGNWDTVLRFLGVGTSLRVTNPYHVRLAREALDPLDLDRAAGLQFKDALAALMRSITLRQHCCDRDWTGAVADIDAIIEMLLIICASGQVRGCDPVPLALLTCAVRLFMMFVAEGTCDAFAATTAAVLLARMAVHTAPDSTAKPGTVPLIGMAWHRLLHVAVRRLREFAATAPPGRLTRVRVRRMYAALWSSHATMARALLRLAPTRRRAAGVWYDAMDAVVTLRGEDSGSLLGYFATTDPRLGASLVRILRRARGISLFVIAVTSTGALLATAATLLGEDEFGPTLCEQLKKRPSFLGGLMLRFPAMPYGVDRALDIARGITAACRRWCSESETSAPSAAATVSEVPLRAIEACQLFRQSLSARRDDVLASTELAFSSADVCRVCSAPARGHVCGACRRTRYCSRACQRQHWSEHRALCDRIAGATIIA